MTRFFQKSVALWRWSTVTPTRGHFLINYCKRDLFSKRSREVWGAASVIQRERRGLESCLQGSHGSVSPYPWCLAVCKPVLSARHALCIYIHSFSNVSVLLKLGSEGIIYKSELSLAQDPRGSSVAEPISEFTTEFDSTILRFWSKTLSVL
jgi:hypothetical protein